MNDAYDIGEISFDDAIWMRTRKHNRHSVAVAQAARRLVKARDDIQKAYDDAEQARTELNAALAELHEEREKQ